MLQLARPQSVTSTAGPMRAAGYGAYGGCGSMSTTNMRPASASAAKRPSNDGFPSPDPQPSTEKGSVQLRVFVHDTTSYHMSCVPFTLMRSVACARDGCQRSSPRL